MSKPNFTMRKSGTRRVTIQAKVHITEQEFEQVRNVMTNEGDGTPTNQQVMDKIRSLMQTGLEQWLWDYDQAGTYIGA